MRRWWPSPANVRIMKGNSSVLLSGYILPTEILCFGLPTVSNDKADKTSKVYWTELNGAAKRRGGGYKREPFKFLFYCLLHHHCHLYEMGEGQG